MIYIDIRKLKTNEDNPRIIKDHEFKKLCKSIKDNKNFFESRPVIVDHEYKIIAGNQRYNASKHIGLKEIPVYVLPKDISKKELDSIMLIDNRHNGDWDWDKLTSGFDMSFLKDEIGFTNDEYSFDKNINENYFHIQDEKEKVISDIHSGKIKITVDMLPKDVKDEIIEELKKEQLEEIKDVDFNKRNKEINIDELGKGLNNECPRCKFQF